MATHKKNQRRTNPSLPSERRLETGARPQLTHHLNPPASSLQSPASHRRGVILLVLLGMLALFGATVFAFLVIASHGNLTAKSLQKAERVDFTSQHDLEQAMRQVLRGPDPGQLHSVLRHHSLLQDLYGSSDSSLDEINGGSDTAIGGWVINSYTLPPSDAATWNNPKLPGDRTIPGLGAINVLFPPQDRWPNDPSLTPPDNQQYDYAFQRSGGQIIDFIAGYTIPAGQFRWGGSVTWPETTTVPLKLTDPNNPTTAEYYFGQSGEEFSRRVGCVLTIIDPNSALYNKSTRIVGYWRHEVRDPTTGNLQIAYHRYKILPFEGVLASDTVNYFKNNTSPGFNFVINGTPFSGTGAGYDTTNRTNDAEYQTSWPYALLPNPTDRAYHDPANNALLSANEDYDAPDYQNMLLALEKYDNAAMNVTRSPSLHRPALANYWLQRLARYFYEKIDPSHSDPTNGSAKAWAMILQPFGADGGWDTLTGGSDDEDIVDLTTLTVADRRNVLTLKRRCLLRPLREDHPNFDGSNSQGWPVFDGPNSPLPPALNLATAYSPQQLQVMARASWGAVSLNPINTFPWFVDGDGDFILDDFNSSGTPDEEAIPWDVDNDGDGIPDSIWADLGLPIRSFPDGRKYKPLVAIHCIDLDGKINLNTAGSNEQFYAKFQANSLTAPPPQGYLADGTVYAQNLTASGMVFTPAELLRGQGAGTAEISPLPVLGNNTTLYQNLLLGNGAIEGRYGEMTRRLPVISGEFRWPAPGYTATNYNYYLNPPSLEKRMLARFVGYPANYYASVANGNALGYGTPLDLKGTMAIGLDLFGQPIYSPLGGMNFDSSNNYQNLTWGWNNAAFAAAGFDTPYELKLGTSAPQSVGTRATLDNPFTVAELEPLLRHFDNDVDRLPDRLRRLLLAGAGSAYRRRVTTESYDLPVPNLALPEGRPAIGMTPAQIGLREAWDDIPASRDRQPQHVSDLIAAKVRWLAGDEATHTIPNAPRVALPTSVAPNPFYPSGIRLDLKLPAGADTNEPYELRVDTSDLLSPDVIAGLRMDLNRAFGNGRDDPIDTDGDGVPDVPPNNVIDEPFEETMSFEDRQEYARTLYVLMMALVDPNWYPHWDIEIIDPNPVGVGGAIPTPLLDTPEKVRARARAIAQWAINVVDYRDADSIMTPFEYDIYPFAAHRQVGEGELFDTWNVDGDVTTQYMSNVDYPGTTNDPDLFEDSEFRGVVWGCERPELLISETLAFHDTGTKDLATPDDLTTDPAPDTDEDYDQVFAPKGHFFVELYNPQSPAEAKHAEFYRDETGVYRGGVLLDKLHAANGSPVWRMAVTVRGNTADTPIGIPQGYLDPDAAYSLSSADRSPPVRPERLIYFTGNGTRTNVGDLNTPPDTVYDGSLGDDDAIFYPSESSATASVAVAPREYAVIGSATQDSSGSVDGVNQVGHLTETGATNGVDPRRIELGPTGSNNVAVYGDGNTDEVDAFVSSGNIRPPLSIRIDMPRRLSVSEPTDGYNLSAYEASGALAPDPLYNNELTFQPPLDQPLDLNPTAPYDQPLAERPFYVHGQEGTHPNFRYVHLQRLANPLLAYNPVSNPYLTIDTAPVDLTVMSAEDNGTGFGCYSRQRGEYDTGLWASSPPRGDDTIIRLNVTTGVNADHTFHHELCQSLGYLNHSFYINTPSVDANDAPLNPNDFGLPAQYLGAPGNYDGTGAITGFTSEPFQWLTWLNRPFANPMELMQVPATSSSQLLMSYSSVGGSRYLAGEEAFGQLPNFFAAAQDTFTYGSPADATGKLHQYRQYNLATSVERGPSHLYRLFEYVHVPSRFIDSQIDSRAGLLSTYREPGKINLNTLAEQDILTGLMNRHALANEFTWNDFANTRRAYVSTDVYGLETANPLLWPLTLTPSPNPPLPTRMANPFRSFAGKEMVSSVPKPEDPSFPADYLKTVVQEGVNATLLRARVDPADPTDPLENRNPLFVDVNADATQKYNNVDENPFFRTESLQRLSNLVTTRSNVYAVWVTVGYFEVELEKNPNVGPTPTLVDPSATLYHQLYPEGYMLGQELGADTGDVKRHRAFYIIDRSIPVGFIPGKDLNTEKAILLRRYIE